MLLRVMDNNNATHDVVAVAICGGNFASCGGAAISGALIKGLQLPEAYYSIIYVIVKKKNNNNNYFKLKNSYNDLWIMRQ